MGGDFYDYIPLDNHRFVIMMGDVMGHGVGAALLMAAVRSALNVLSGGDLGINDILLRVNKMLIKDLGKKKFLITLFYGILDTQTGKLIFANAGHEYPFILRGSSSTLEFLESTGTIIGMFEECSYKQSEIQLNPGDIVLFYTDGVVEVKAGPEEQFGKERLYHLVEENRNLPAKELVDKIYNEAVTFSGSKLMSDDLLLLAIKLRV
ncbi:MAG: PP2C family protein-serine/threonine phosphatase [Deltaproteobacteria bacterium]|nr:PP2C family protein-serine/threonine phosphatase [Deltaproteobacteria bacterium]